MDTIPVYLQRPNQPRTRIEVGQCLDGTPYQQVADAFGLEIVFGGRIARIKGSRALLIIADGWKVES